jgi:hypothetical protein
MLRIAFVALAMISAPALAAPHYRAEPAAKPEQARFVAKDVVWRCGESGCSGAKGNSRPAIVCAALAKEIGRLRSFSAGGEELSNGELDKCNARAGAAQPK